MKIDRSTEISHENPIVKSLFVQCQFYVEQGRGTLWEFKTENGFTVSANNFRANNPKHYWKKRGEMKRFLRSAGFCETDKGVWKPRISK